MAATIRLVSAFIPMCSFRQDRRVRVPCYSGSHSPEPHSFAPCCSPAGARERSRAAATPSPAFRPCGPWGSRPALPNPARARRGWSRSGLRSGTARAEHGSQRQRCGNGQGRVVWFPASLGLRLGFSGSDRSIHKPDREAATLAQGRVTGRGVRHLSTAVGMW